MTKQTEQHIQLQGILNYLGPGNIRIM